MSNVIVLFHLLLLDGFHSTFLPNIDDNMMASQGLVLRPGELLDNQEWSPTVVVIVVQMNPLLWMR